MNAGITGHDATPSHGRRGNVASKWRARPRHLHAVTRCDVRPRWRALYAGVALAIVAGASAHAFIGRPFGIRAADGCAVVLAFGWMFCWIGRSRIALAQLGSAPPIEAAVVIPGEIDSGPEETWLPYDFC